MTDLLNDIPTAFERPHDSGRIGLLVDEVIAAQSKATPSRGQIAAMVLAGFAGGDSEFRSIEHVAAVSVKWADALLAELAKPREET